MPKAGKNAIQNPVDEDATPEVAAPHAGDAPAVEGDSELVGVPYLGAVRIAALASAGISTIAELRAASAEAIGGVKGVGLRNAERIKSWLADQDAAASPDSAHDAEVPVELSDIDTAVTRIKEANPKKDLDKKLSRQLNKVLTRVSGVPAAFESLGNKDRQQAIKQLDRIAALLAQAAERGRLSDKKQHIVGGAIKAGLKKLDKVLDD